jgi:putative transposase
LGLTEIKELRRLRDENARLKYLVADLTLDKHILAEVVRKNSKAGTTASARALDTSATRSPRLVRWSAVTHADP